MASIVRKIMRGIVRAGNRHHRKDEGRGAATCVGGWVGATPLSFPERLGFRGVSWKGRVGLPVTPLPLANKPVLPPRASWHVSHHQRSWGPAAGQLA